MKAPVQIGDCTLYLVLAMMVFYVLSPRHNFEVFNTVIGFVFILVVNDFIVAQWSADVILHQNAMLATASVFAVTFRCQHNIAVRIVRFSLSKVPMVRPATANCFALQAPATSCNSFTKSPTFNCLCGQTIASTFPVMKLPSFAFICRHNQPSKTLSCEIGNFVLSPIARGGF